MTSIDRAKELINEYYLDEFGYEASFDNLENVDLAFAGIGEKAEHDCQISVDLLNFRLIAHVAAWDTDFIADGERKYESLDELIEKELKRLDWDELIGFGCELLQEE